MAGIELSNIEVGTTRTAACIAAVVAIYASIKKVWKFLHSLAEKFEMIDDMYLNQLRITIMSCDMPLEERVKAGEKYISLGGNGEVKHRYRDLLEELCESRKHGE